MADNTIDTLSLEIVSSSSQANKALDNLARKLLNLNKALQSVNTGGLRNYARDMGRVSSSIKALNGIKVNIPNLSGLSKQLESLGKVDFSALTGAAQPLKDLSAGLRSLNGMQNISIPKLDAKNINSVVSAAQKLSGVDTAKIPLVSDGIEKLANSMTVLQNVGTVDKGINTTINALNRLFSIDMSNFNPDSFSSIATSISSLASIPDVSSGLNRFMSSLQKLANAGPAAAQVAAALPDLGTALKDTVNKMASAGNVSDSVNMFTQSIGRLASAGAKTGQTAAGLQNLAEETLKFFQAMQNAPKISQNTIAMTQALAQLASAGGRVGAATGTITSAFNKLSGLATKSASAIKKAASGISSAFQKIGSSSGGLKSASFNLGTLFKTAIGLRAVKGLFDFGRSAIDLGSNITEVENVVDKSFGNLNYKVYDFAKTAKEQFGLSELAAKQYSGTMMGMLKSSGVVVDEAADMSIQLAELAGDYASFWNISTEEAFTKIRAGISGENEPLKQLGKNLSVANLQAYALSQGITKSYQSMSQAEQVTLRYNYLLSVSNDEMGDYALNAGTWANQTRLLTLNLQSLSAVIGQGLIAAILPAVQALNFLLSKLMQVAEAFRTFMYTLMGKKVEGSTSGIVNELSGLGDISTGLEDVGTSGSDAGDGMDDATNAAKKLKKALSVLPFDELNQLAAAATDTGDGLSKAGTGTAGALDNLGFGGLADAIHELGETDAAGPINEWAKRIREAFLAHDWEGLGKEIAWGVNNGLQFLYDVLNWNKVGPKITAFTSAFTKTLNSLVDNVDFDLMGRTVGTGINTLVNTFNQLIGPGGIDFKNIGTKLSTGLRGAVDEIEWTNLGNLLGNKFMIAWNILNGFVTDMSRKNDAGLTGWAQLGISLGNAANGIFDRIDFGQIANTLTTGINGAFEALANFTKTFEWDDLVQNIQGGITEFLSTMEWEENGKAFGDFLRHLCEAIKGVMTKDTFYELGKGIGQFLGELPWDELLETAAGVIINAIAGLLEGLWDSGNIGKIAAGISGAFLAVKVLDITGIGTLATKIISHFATKFKTQQNIDTLAQALGSVISSGSEGATTALGGLGEAAGGASSKVGGLGEALSGLGFAGAIVGIVEGIAKLQEFTDKLKGGNGKLSEFGGIMDSISSQFAPELSQKIFDLKEKMEDSGATSDEIKTKFIKLFTDAGVSADTLRAAFSNVAGSINVTAQQEELFQGIIEGVAKSSETMGEKVDASGIKASKVYDAIKNSLVDLQKDGVIPSQEHMNILMGTLDETSRSGGVTKEMLEAVSEQMGYMNIDASNLESTLNTKLPGAFGNITSSASDASGATSGVDAMLDGLGSTASIVSTAKLALLALAFGALESSGKLSKDELKELDGALDSAGDNGGDLTPVLGDIKDVLDGAGVSASDFGTALLTSASEIKDQLPSNFEEIISNIETFAIQIEANGKNAGENYPSGMAQGISDNSSLASDAASEMADDVNAAAKKGLDENSPSKIAEGYGKYYDEGLANGITGNISLATNSVTKMIDAMKALFPIQNEEFRKFGKNYGIYLKNGFTQMSVELNAGAKDLIEKLKNVFPAYDQDFYDFGYNYSERLIEGINSLSTEAFNAANNIVKNLLNAFGDLGSTLYYKGQSAAYSFANGISSVHIPMPHISVDANTRSTQYGYSYNMSSRVNWYKAGGLFSSPAVIGIGEAGNEVALPLENKRTMSMIADSILSNASGMGMDEEVLTNAVARGVAMAMMNNQQVINVNCYAELKTDDETLARSAMRGQQKIDYRMNPTPQLG